jgi:hypothetical protein
MQFSSSVTLGHAAQNSVISAEGQMYASMTHPPTIKMWSRNTMP